MDLEVAYEVEVHTTPLQPHPHEDQDEVVFLGHFKPNPAFNPRCTCLNPFHPREVPVLCHPTLRGHRIIPVQPQMSTFVNAKYFTGTPTNNTFSFFPQPPESEWLSVPVFHLNPHCNSWHPGAPQPTIPHLLPPQPPPHSKQHSA